MPHLEQGGDEEIIYLGWEKNKDYGKDKGWPFFIMRLGKIMSII